MSQSGRRQAYCLECIRATTGAAYAQRRAEAKNHANDGIKMAAPAAQTETTPAATETDDVGELRFGLTDKGRRAAERSLVMTRLGLLFRRRVARIGELARAGDLQGVREAALDAQDLADAWIAAVGGRP